MNSSSTSVSNGDYFIINYFSEGLLTAILSLIIFLALFGNLLVCIAISTDKFLRRKSNSLYISLATADLILAFLVMSCELVQFRLKTWPFGYLFCKIFIALDVMCCTASILNLLAIACDRYFHISRPFWYRKHFTRFSFFLIILTIWFASTLVSFIPILMNWHVAASSEERGDLLEEENIQECKIKFNIFYAILSSCISFYLPTIIMLTIYIKLFTFAQKHVSKINNYHHKPSSYHGFIKKDFNNSAINLKKNKPEELIEDLKISIKINKSSSNVNNNKKRIDKNLIMIENEASKRITKADHKAAITLGIILGTYLTCWMPFFIINCIHAIFECISPFSFAMVTWLGYFNSCLNPIIYSLFNTKFRHAFIRILVPGFLKQRKSNHCCFYFNDSNHQFKLDNQRMKSINNNQDSNEEPKLKKLNDNCINSNFKIDLKNKEISRWTAYNPVDGLQTRSQRKAADSK